MNNEPTARGGRLAGLASDRTRALARRVLESFPLALGILLVAGLALRLILTMAYQPAVLTFADSAAYVGMAHAELFTDPARPTGYSIVLRAVHAVSSDLEAVITLQHLLGLLTGIVIYATVRRVGAPVWAAIVGAAAVILSLDQVYLEHSLASEATFSLLFVVAICCAVRALEEPRVLRGVLTSRHLWLLGAGLLFGVSAWIRAVSLPLLPFFALWVLLAMPGSWRGRLANGVVALAPAVAVLLVYFSLNQGVTGTFGITQSGGWAAYARAAPFADCTKFDPPAGTESLCETTPADERNGPDFYTWQEDSPAQKLFGFLPEGNEQLAAFGRGAITHQPLEYAEAVGRDFVRYFAPALGARPYGGVDYQLLAIDLRDPPIEQDLLARFFNPYYDDEVLELTSAVSTLADVQEVLRVHPLLLLAALVLSVAGVWFSRGRVRWTIVLSAGAALVAMFIAVAIGTYNARYVVPVEGPLVAAGALGLWVLIEAYRRRREPPAEAGTAQALA